MQPCSQPWYGLIDWVNGMSGESLRLMMVRACWMRTVVFGGAAAVPSVAVSSTGGAQPSSTGSRVRSAKRLSGLNVAPRPLRGGGLAAGRTSVRRDGGGFIVGIVGGWSCAPMSQAWPERRPLVMAHSRGFARPGRGSSYVATRIVEMLDPSQSRGLRDA